MGVFAQTGIGFRQVNALFPNSSTIWWKPCLFEIQFRQVRRNKFQFKINLLTEDHLGKCTWPYLTGDHQNDPMPYLFEDTGRDLYEQRFWRKNWNAFVFFLEYILLHSAHICLLIPASSQITLKIKRLEKQCCTWAISVFYKMIIFKWIFLSISI